MARSPHSHGAASVPSGSGRPVLSPGHTSGTHRMGIAGLRDILKKYISPILLESVLSRAIEHHAREDIPAEDLLKVVTADCMIGLRLFVKPDLLPELMLELAEFIEERS